jgi:hypothetical protein
MRDVEFRDRIVEELRRTPTGRTRKELRDRLALPHDRPCPTWVRHLEQEAGVVRERGPGRALVWRAHD